MKSLRGLFASLVVAALLLAPVQSRQFHGGIASGGGGSGTLLAAITIHNPSGSSVSNVQQQYMQPFKLGDVASNQKVEIRKSDGTTVVTTQEGPCSTWAQDTSRQTCPLNFVQPDTVTAGGSVQYKVYAVSGSPNTTQNVSLATIQAQTNICVKSTDLTQSNGTALTGTWDFICLNNVLANFSQYNASTGYGSNPKGGWEYTTTGPVATGVHAFQYAMRESDSAYHKWLRTDLWVTFTNGTTACPCKISAIITAPNIFGAISGATVGAATQPGHVFSATLSNGANTLYNWGGAADPRNITNLTSSNFNTTTNQMTLAVGHPYTKAAGPFAVRFTSTGSVPGGLTSGGIFYLQMWGANNIFTSPDVTQIYPYACRVGWTGYCGSALPTTLTTTGSGTITMTPYVYVVPNTSATLLDNTGQEIWTNSAGAVTTAPVTLLAHDFSYLTQATKVTPPYITALAGNLSAGGASSTWVYYPNSWYLYYDVNQGSAAASDQRIGYFPLAAARALFNPADPYIAQLSRVYAAAFTSFHFFNMDETVGLPPIFNNGPAKNGVTYPSMGAVQVSQRTFPFQTGSWATPSLNEADVSPYEERYGVRADGSHLPAPQLEAILRTANPLWRFTLAQEANAWLGNMGTTSTSISGTNYYRIGDMNNQTRGAAWGGRVLDMADIFEPDNSPMAQYFHDLEKDNADWLYLWHTTVSNTAIRTLGYYYVDQGANNFQPWQDDYLFMRTGLQAWRGEYSNYSNFATNYFQKFAIGRMDSAVGGCLWAGPTRIASPYTGVTPGIYANLAQNWTDHYTRSEYNTNLTSNVQGAIAGTVLTVSSVNYTGPLYTSIAVGNTVYAGQVSKGTITSLGTGTGGTGTYNLSASNTVGSTQIDISEAHSSWQLPPYWAGCPASGLAPDVGSSSIQDTTGIASMAASSLGMGAVLGVSNASTLYSSFRSMQYTAGLSFTGSADSPVYAMGPLGAMQ